MKKSKIILVINLLINWCIGLIKFSSVRRNEEVNSAELTSEKIEYLKILSKDTYVKLNAKAIFNVFDGLSKNFETNAFK
ncbi:MAG: hypothetical protein LBP63_01835 [Prevotellaceae bacterium]|jgi:hypothetical protein|nr:hypothetical protein [Prevotellaceae bacterium]